LCTKLRERDWFSVSDVGGRVARVVVLNYYLMVAYPKSFLTYTYKYNTLWYGKTGGLLLTSFYLVTPLAMLGLFVGKRIMKNIRPIKSFDDGNVFFVSPPSLLASILWDMCKDYGMFIGCFLLVGTNEEGILHTHHDEVTVKTYWRKLLEDAGAEIPRQLGSWDGKSLTWGSKWETDIVVKLPDSYLGIGDLFLEYEKDFKTEDDVKAILKKEHPGKTGVLLLDWIRPRKDMEVHQLDIVTVRTAEGVKPLSILYWGDCSGPSSHSCRAGYICDYESESIIAPAKWYSYAFVNMKAKSIGQKLPGLKDAVNTAIKAHEKIEFKWLKAAGWDCMITDRRGPVFFEGNLAGARFPRRVFLDWANLRYLPKAVLAVASE
jgi:hypothetical protein